MNRVLTTNSTCRIICILIFLICVTLSIVSCGSGIQEKIKNDASKVIRTLEISITERDKKQYLSQFSNSGIELKSNPWLEEIDSYHSVTAKLEVIETTLQIFPNGISEISATVKRHIALGKGLSDEQPTIINDQVTYYLRKSSRVEASQWEIANSNYNYNESDTKPTIVRPPQ